MDQRIENALVGRLIEIRDAAEAARKEHREKLPSLQTVADAAGMTRSKVSQIANGITQLKTGDEERLWSALNRLGLDKSDTDAYVGQITEEDPDMPNESDELRPKYKRAVEIYQTQQFLDAWKKLESYRKLRKMAVMHGHPGSGKTTILKEYAKRTPGVKYIECWSSMHEKDLMKKLAASIGVRLSGNTHECEDMLGEALKERDDVMFLLDEAEQLYKWNMDKFDTMRKLCENSGTPLILAGTERLLDMVKFGVIKRQNMSQLVRRSFEIGVAGIKEGEVRAILRDYDVEPRAANELARIAVDVEHGGMGNFVEILELALLSADGGRVTIEIVEGIEANKILY